MIKKTVGDFIVERLHEWGVRRIFGYPGDGINGVLGALERSDGLIDFVQVRHEEMAAFMACAYAKFTGEMGVCLSTGGPGASHLITGLYDAKLDHMPVLAITGQAPRAVRGGHYQQELNLARMFSDVAEFVQELETPAQIGLLVDRGVRMARSRRGVAVLVLPGDLQEEPHEQPPQKHGFIRTGVGYTPPVIVPQQGELKRAANVLNAGERVAVLIGAGAAGADAEVLEVADLLGAGVAKALLGKDVLPDEAPGCTGGIGLLGTRPSWDLMTGCDTLLMVGSGFPYSEFLPRDGQARGVQIDIDASMLSLRYPMEVNLQGDARATLQSLIPLLKRKADRRWRDELEKGVADWWKTLEARALQPAQPINPQRVTWELSPLLPDGAIVTSDSGSCANWYARDLRIRAGMRCSLSGGLASMGAAVPYAIAAKFAQPDRPVIALVGDGAMQMNNMAELITVAKYWKRWPSPRWICCVFNNEDLNQVTWEQRIMQGFPKFPATQDLPDVPYHRFAELIGLAGIFCDKPDEVAEAWKTALACDRPVVLEFKTDPEVPPLPPHITFDQARHFMKTLIAGDPSEGALVKGAARQVMSEVLPHDRK